ncbi:TIR domain-containing protein [Flavilitoribacter nigricans]|uniref:TIR domain-containing protein n=1 Tax=Flavilitoribacter nigricans (strain ATCC 23147 / DSM 23189 / NBRC 102662 / NCIMB 1420 / SS-2) TaxID=1122177 RepID=A0A2D0N6Q1_FLAN2|nr:TIR domain-containing protein [Flavilitoribacter nigricans]PHN03453.1 hypothetical protein CRP01_27620 [Flavilitoribacter nigricans DSM 23189 = NBRC 102662]
MYFPLPPPPKLLLIDDDHEFCQELRQALGNVCDLEIANNKGDALAKVRQKKYQVLLLDLFIENKDHNGKPDGLDFLSEIYEIDCNLPVVIISNNKDARIARDAFKEFRVWDFIYKGDPFQKLHDRIQDIIKLSVFISYSSKDRKFVDLLLEQMDNASISYWQDVKKIKPGQSLNHSIPQGIAKASHYLVVLSKHSIKSSWVKRELYFAQENEKLILPLVYDPGDWKLPDEIKFLISDAHQIHIESPFKREVEKIAELMR